MLLNIHIYVNEKQVKDLKFKTQTMIKYLIYRLT